MGVIFSKDTTLFSLYKTKALMENPSGLLHLNAIFFNYTNPCAIIADATFLKPAILAPATKS